jgi:hypothetical protein
VKSYTVSQKRARAEAIWAESRYRSYSQGVDGFIRWCSEIFYVRNKQAPSGRSLFDLYDFQREAAEAYFSNKYVVVLKSRQAGFTTLGMAYAMWQSIYKPGGATVLVLSKTQVDARANLQMVKHALSFMPGWYVRRMPELEAESNDRMVFRHADGSMSQLECLVATERSGASRTADLVVADECALWSKPSDTMRSIAPATDAASAAAGEEAVMLVFSTARGGSNYFANLYRDAAAGKNQYKSIFVPWTRNPLSNPGALRGEVDYSVVNARKAEFAAEPHRFASEYPSSPEDAFKSSGHSRFVGLPSIMEFDEFPFRGRFVSFGTEVQWEDDANGPVRLAFDPRDKDTNPAQSHRVFVGADPALGVGGDSSVVYAVAYDGAGQMHIVGYYASNDVEPSAFADVLWDFGWFFGGVNQPALVACEYQPAGGGGGATVVGRLRDRGYHNLYRYIQPAAKGRKALSYYGMPITRGTKPLLVNTLADWLTADESIGVGADALGLQGIPPVLRDELASFVVKPNGTTSADTGCHDDHVLAVAIAVYVAATSTRAPTPKGSNVGNSPGLPDGVLRLDLSGLRKQVQSQQAAAKRRRGREVARYRRKTRKHRGSR